MKNKHIKQEDIKSRSLVINIPEIRINLSKGCGITKKEAEELILPTAQYLFKELVSRLNEINFGLSVLSRIKPEHVQDSGKVRARSKKPKIDIVI